MMNKWLESFDLIFKSAELTAALVTIDELLHPSGQKPINQGKNRQAQSISKRDKDNANQHNEAPDELVKILRRIKLPALASRAIIENAAQGIDLAPGIRALRTGKRGLFSQLDRGVLFAARTMAGNGFHKKNPNFIK